MRFANVEAVIRNESIECPYCASRAPVDRQYSPIRAACPNCGAQFQITRVVPLTEAGEFARNNLAERDGGPRRSDAGSKQWWRFWKK